MKRSLSILLLFLCVPAVLVTFQNGPVTQANDTNAHRLYLPFVSASGEALPVTCEVLPQSDTFSTNGLNEEFWEFVDPVGDAALTIDDAGASIAVPAGSTHRLWDGDYTVARLMQAMDDIDFDVEVAFDSLPNGTYAYQGIVVEGRSNGVEQLLRIELNSSSSNLRVFAAAFEERVNSDIFANSAIGDTNTMTTPIFLRVQRINDKWTAWYSSDGLQWESFATFESSFEVTNIGVYTGNEGSSPPAHTAVVQRFTNRNCIAVELPVISELDYTYDPETRDLTVSWKTDKPTTAQVEYGLTETYGNTQNDTLLKQTHNLTIPNLQPDTVYHFRATATDEDDNTTSSPDIVFTTYANAPDDLIDVWYGQSQSFGSPGRPQRWVNILGSLTNPNNMTLTYALNGDADKPLTIGPDNRRLENPGDFNVELDYIDLLEGLNTVTITATDQNDETYVETVILDYTFDETWPLPYSINWSNAASIQDVADVADGLWTIDRNTSTVRAEPGYDRLIVIGDVTWQDFEVEVPITIHQLETRTGSPAYPSWVGVIMRWQGNRQWDDSQPSWGWWPLGAVPMYGETGTKLQIMGNDLTRLTRYPLDVYNGAEAIDNDLVLQESETYIFKMQVQSRPDDVSLYRVKVWEQGTTEPAEWNLEAYGLPRTETERGELKAGSIGLITYYTDASFGNVSIRPLSPLPNSLTESERVRLEMLQENISRQRVNDDRSRRSVQP